MQWYNVFGNDNLYLLTMAVSWASLDQGDYSKIQPSIRILEKMEHSRILKHKLLK